MAETITLTSSVEKRAVFSDEAPCWERVITAFHDDDDTPDVTLALTLNGILQKIVFKVPNYTNSITGQIVIKDSGANIIFDSGEKTKNDTYFYSLQEPFTGTISVIMGISGAAGGTGGSMVATLRGV